MGLIKWWNAKFNKPAEMEVKPQENDKCQDCGADAGHFSHCTGSTVKRLDVTLLSDEDRVTNYFASGGEIVDLSNKPRKPNDGFESDQDLMKPWNQAHAGTKAGIAAMGKKR